MTPEEPRAEGGWLVYALALLVMAVVVMLAPPLLALMGVR